MLGKNDFAPLINEIKLPMGFNRLFNSLIKNLGKELNKDLSDMNKQTKIPKGQVRKTGVSIRISTSRNNPPEIKIDSFRDKKA